MMATAGTLLSAAVTVLGVFLGLYTMMLVGRMRSKHAVDAPATTGAPEFERAFRVQMNTQENMLIFLPALWLFSIYVSPMWAGLLGVLWLIGRTHYAVSYARSASERSLGFGVGLLAFGILAIGAAIGVAIKIFAEL